ncbi:PH domain-containing protein [Clostridium sp. B9]|uniref:PH domain-containing protein n=1 Tax=Clostridium sp. B9 TaxID=3423224 RepID=UPI003D2ED1C5
MFKKIASDALGLSDIGKVISPKDYDKVDADDYIMHEDGEEIYFLIKSKSDEYCFTNRALIHVDGANAVSKKRNLYRYEYYSNNINNVSLETAGTVDLDVEIKFSIGDKYFSIDVDKNQLEQLKDLYKALIKISQIKAENAIKLEHSVQTLQMATQVMGSNRVESNNIGLGFKEVNEYAFDWLTKAREAFIVKDFGEVFQKYINN